MSHLSSVGCLALFGLAALAAVMSRPDSAAGEPQPAAETGVFELRTYTALPGKLDALNARFRDHTLKLFEKHGIRNVVYLTPAEGDKASNTLVYLISHPSREAADKSWAAFRADPEWQQARAESEKDGKLLEKVESVFLVPTDYSPLKK